MNIGKTAQASTAIDAAHPAAAQHQLESERRARLLAELADDIVVGVGADHTMHHVSPAVERVLGWSVQQCVGREFGLGVHPDDQALLRRHCEACWRTLDGISGPGFVARSQRRDGSWAWLEYFVRAVPEGIGRDDAIAFVCVLRDITDLRAAEQALDAANARLSTVAGVDSLTGLANRSRFDEALAAEWGRLRRERRPLAMLIADVDHFRTFNDHHGHATADAALCVVGGVAREAARRASDVVARYAGESFALLLPDTETQNAMNLAERVRGTVERTEIVAGPVPALRLKVSIGVACTTPPPGSTGPDALSAAAEAALAQAKRGGRNRVEWALSTA